MAGLCVEGKLCRSDKQRPSTVKYESLRMLMDSPVPVFPKISSRSSRFQKACQTVLPAMNNTIQQLIIESVYDVF